MEQNVFSGEGKSINSLKERIEKTIASCKQNLPKGDLNKLLDEVENYHRELEKKNQQLEEYVKKLEYNEELLREMGRVAKIGGWEFDPENGKGTWTEETAIIHDMDPRDETNAELGMSFYEAQSKKKIEAAVKMAIGQNKPYDLELELTTAKGRHKWVRTIGKPIVKNGKVVKMRGSFQDITEAKKQQQAIEEREENLRTTLLSIGDAVIATDTAGRITRMNPVAESLTGWNFSEAGSKKIEDVFHIVNAHTGKKQENPVAKVLENGEIVELANHTKLISKNGQEYQISDSGAPIMDKTGKITGVVLVFRDVTGKYKIQEALEESERTLLTLMGNLPGMAYRCKNDAHWTMEFVSLGCLGLTGHEPEELTGNSGLTFIDLIFPEDRNRVWAKTQEALKLNEPFVIEYRIRDKTGNERWVWEQGRAVDENTSGFKYLEGFIMDITERKKAEEELQKLKDGLETQVREKTKELQERVKELERFHQATIDREFRIKELRDEIEKLKAEKFENE